MTDTFDDYKSIKEHRARLREKYGKPCAMCVRLLPRARPTILLPQQRCRIHGFVDLRPELTELEWRMA
jgi:hypothetical protein